MSNSRTWGIAALPENGVLTNVDKIGVSFSCDMDEETLNRITEMFFTTKKNGTGLGIALSNEIIKAHNGTLEYKSDKEKGTQVKIKLPVK